MLVTPYPNAIGTTIIDNTTGVTKTYYLMQGSVDIRGNYSANWNNLGGSQWAENSIVAYPAN